MTQPNEKGEKNQIFVVGMPGRIPGSAMATLADIRTGLLALVVEDAQFFLFQVEDGLVLPDDLLVIFE